MGAPAEEMSATSILSLFDTTKEQRRGFIQQVIESVLNGYKNPLDIQVQIKCMEEITKGIYDDPDYKRTLVDEAEKYGRKPFEFHNANVQVKEAGTKYDFSNTNDAGWKALDNEMLELKAKLKAREDFLKKLPTEGIDIIDSEGETYKIYPPSKSSTTTISITLK
jgi:hypothetical protein